METNTKYTIHRLCEESVIIEKRVTSEWNGNSILLSEVRTDYPNNDFGQQALLKEIKDQNIIDAILTIFRRDSYGISNKKW